MTNMSSEPPFNERQLRLRAILNAQFTVILAVCLLAAAIGFGLVYTTHLSPTTETETQTMDILTVETEHSHSAVVTESNPVFDMGTVLDDRNTYFTGVSPRLDVDVETAYSAAAADVDLTVESVLVIRNVEDDIVHWDRHERLATQDATGVEPEEPVDVSFSLDSTAIDETAGAIEAELGNSPGETETVVQTTVGVDGTVEGESVSETQTLEMEIQHDGDTYSVSGDGVESTSADRTEQVTVERTYGPLRSIGGPLLAIVGIVGAVGLRYAHQRDEFEITAAESEYLSYRDDCSEFDEWITHIRLPQSVTERETATAETLGDLVDFAIDRETGVVHDPNTGIYYAVSDDVVYTYTPPIATAPLEAEAEAAETQQTTETPTEQPEPDAAEQTD